MIRLSVDTELKVQPKDFSDAIALELFKRAEKQSELLIEKVFDFSSAKFLQQRMKYNTSVSRSGLVFSINFYFNNYIELEAILDSGGVITFKWQDLRQSKDDIATQNEERNASINKTADALESSHTLKELGAYLNKESLGKLNTQTLASSFSSSGKRLIEKIIEKGFTYV